MLCPGHQDGAGPLTCCNCGTPGCSGCFEQINGSPYCTDCLLKRLEGAEAQFRHERLAAEVCDVQGEAKRRIRRNWILTCLFSLVGIPGAISTITSDNTLSASAKTLISPVAALTAVYLIWASLWGIPAAWRWWKHLFSNKAGIVFASGFGWLLLLVGFFVIPLEFGYMYGVFGGAIYEYRKAKMISQDAAI